MGCQMNKKRREMLGSAIALLDRASVIVNTALDQEQDCIDNMPENLQMSDRCEKMECAVEFLEDAVSCIEEATSKIQDSVM